jgi:hypothetical protein
MYQTSCVSYCLSPPTVHALLPFPHVNFFFGLLSLTYSHDIIRSAAARSKEYYVRGWGRDADKA